MSPDRVGLLLLRPDCLVAGTGPALLDVLAGEEGIAAVDLRVLRLTPALFDAVYRTKLDFFGANLGLHHEIAALAPAAAVLVTGDDVAARLAALKGPSSALGEPGGLRERFGRPSSLHAVLHVAQRVEEEIALFFPPEPVPGSPVPRDVRDALLSWTPYPAGTVFAVAAALERRILAACLLRLHRTGRPTGALPDLPDLAGKPFRAARSAYRGDLLGAAAGLADGERPGEDELFDLLEANDVPVSPWERTLVLAGLRVDL